MRSVTYLIYIVFWESLVWIGCGYVVFGLGHSGWWFLLAALLGYSAYKPGQWINGATPPQGGDDGRG